MEFKTISENEFEEYSINHPNANFWQSVNMAHLREWNGWQSESIHTMKTLPIENEDKDLNSLSYDRLKIAGKEERISKESQ